MKDMLTIFRRELGAYFNSAIAYIFLIVFALVINGIYMLDFFLQGQATMRSFFNILPMMLIVFIPAITMRLWADDRKGGTYELLLTFPMQNIHLVLGKFLASFVFYLISLAMTLVIPITLAILGDPDWGPIWGGYIGAIFLGAFFISLGIFISGLCMDQIVAFVLTMVSCFAFFMLGTTFVAAQIDGWTGGLNLGTKVLSFIAMTKHFEAFQRGLVDLRDIIYFISLSGLFLGLNAFNLSSRMRRKAKTRFALNIVVYTALVIFINIVAGGFNLGRFDMTEGKIYTVSKEARAVLSRLKVPVKVNYYVSPKEKMPSMLKSLEQEVIDKLSEFEIASNGNLEFQVNHVNAIDALSVQRKEYRKQLASQFDEETATAIAGEADESEQTEGEKLAEELMEKDIVPFRLRTTEADEITTVSIYSAISIAYKDKDEEVIPQLVPQNFDNFEYDLISRVFRLTQDAPPKVAVVAPRDIIDPQTRQMFAMRGMDPPPPQDNYSSLEKYLAEQKYDVERLDFESKEAIPDDADTVVIVNPRQWDERQRWEVNRALNSGKSVILAVQNYMQDYRRGAQGPEVTSMEIQTGVNDLLKEYGLQVDEDFLMDNNSTALNIETGSRNSIFRMTMPVELPTHIVVQGDGINQDVPITNRLSQILYLWGSALKIDDEKLKENNLNKTVLLSSGEESWTTPFKSGQLKRNDILPPDEYTGPFPLAVMLEGQFPNLYEGKERPKWPEAQRMPNQPPPPEEPEEAPAADLPAKPGKLIVIGGASIWGDNMMRSGNNGLLFLNSVDSLTLGEELIHLRTKAIIDRPLESITAGQRLWYRFFVMGLTPVALALMGIIRLWLRRRAKDNYLREVAA